MSSKDTIIKTRVDANAFYAGIASARQALDAIRESAILKVVDEPQDDDMPEDASYGTTLSRNSRYLMEVLTAAVQFGLTFTVQGEETPLYYALFSVFNDDTSVYNIEARTPARVAERFADVVADLLEDAINDDNTYAKIWTHEVVIEDGKFVNADNGERFADSAQDAADFVAKFPHVRIKIVNSYD